MTKYITLSLAMLAAFGLQAFADGTVNFRYNPAASEVAYWGTGKPETYDVAVWLNDSSLEGKKITGISVPFNVQTPEKVSNPTVWLSTALILEGRDNAPDIAVKKAEIADGVLAAVFDEPYTLTDEPIYVGYSFKVAKNGPEAPVALTSGSNLGGFYLHTSNTYRSWVDNSMKLGYSSAIEVVLLGDFGENAAVFAPATVNLAKDTEVPFYKMPVANHGSMPIASVDYKYTVNGENYSGHTDFATPVPNIYGATGNCGIYFPPLAKGEYDITLEVTAVNGKPNEEKDATATNPVFVYSALPVNRPLMEEFTGTWCGWCPRGLVGLELMNNMYGDNFVAISYHDSDPMMMAAGYPELVSGFPSSYINRVTEADPYYGTGNNGLGIDKVYEKFAKDFVPVSVEAEAEWVSETEVDITSHVCFVQQLEGTYRVEYVLIANSIYEPTNIAYFQSNYYASNSQYLSDPNLAPLVEAGATMIPTFNDVAALTTGLHGLEGSLPAKIKKDVMYDYTCKMDATKAVNTDGLPIITVPDACTAVIYVILDDGSEYGRVVNAAKCPVKALGSVRGPQADNRTVARVEYYDMLGRRVDASTRGMVVRRTVFTDGSSEASKHILR